jgi:hypothetical protein
MHLKKADIIASTAKPDDDKFKFQPASDFSQSLPGKRL